MVTLSPADVGIIIAYCVGVLLVGFLATRRRPSSIEFLLAGRSLTTPIFVMTLVSSWYGGVLGVGEYSYRYGISNWVTQGVPYYIFAAVFAFLLAGRVRATDLVTIPDKLHQAYDRKTAVLGAALTFVLMTPAPYILELAVLLQLVTGWPLLTCILAGTVATTAYLFFGGFRSDVRTDVFEFFPMFLGFAVILPFAFARYGGAEFITHNVPPLHLTWTGGNSVQYVIVWFFIALWTLVDPSFHQRCYAARSGEVARRGILWSIVFWFLFDAMTAIAGLYARAALPGLQQPIMAFPLLAEATLPSIAKGVFYVGMLATVMSTLNTFAFVSATTLGRDVVLRMRGRGLSGNENRSTRWGLVATAMLSIVLCETIPSVIRLWYTIGTVIIPGLLLPLVTSYFPRWKARTAIAFAAMTAGGLTSTGWLLAGWMHATGDYPLGIEPMYPGLFVSACVWGAGKLRDLR
jgi:SSS family solute:Na+ symporter